MKTKSEIRNPKSEGNPKAELKTQFLEHSRSIRASEFGLVSEFGFRISDFRLPLAIGYWLLAIAVCPPARAEVPEPDNRVYGIITLGATPVTAANTNVVVEARKTVTGPVVASYRMGDNPAYGNFYSLPVALEAFFPLTDANASRVGGLIHLAVRDHSGVRDSRTLSIAERGRLVRVDFVELDSDSDGLPDRWEQQFFGSATGGAPTADPDGDGRNNLAEFLEGTHPLVADGRHPADLSPSDNVLTSTEADVYANAWLAGTPWPTAPTNIPISYVARAAALVTGGGAYVFTNSPPTNAPLWWVNTPFAGPRPPGLNSATGLALPTNPPANRVITVTLRVVPTNTVVAFAVQDRPPPGWINVQNISHGGSYDLVNRRVKWGPFYDNGARDLTYDLVRPGSATGLNTFTGTASFDGFDVAIIGARTILIGTSPPPPRWVSWQSFSSGSRCAFVLQGEPMNRYAIEASTNLTSWNTLRTNTADATGATLFNVTNSPPASFRAYRARHVP
jgi:hypothetical protein